VTTLASTISTEVTSNLKFTSFVKRGSSSPHNTFSFNIKTADHVSCKESACPPGITYKERYNGPFRGEVVMMRRCVVRSISPSSLSFSFARAEVSTEEAVVDCFSANEIKQSALSSR
jgi:hypothetical protein